MEQKALISRIMSADRLDTIATLQEEIKQYIASHPDEDKQPIYQASRRLFMMEEGLRAVEAAGLPMEEVYRLRDKREQQSLAGQTPAPWPEEWRSVLQNP